MTTVYPGAIDALPRPGPTTKRDAAAGLNLSTVIDNLSDAVEAIEPKVGTGASTPTIPGQVLTVTAAGATAYATPTAATQPLTINGNMDHFQRLGAGVRTSTTTWNRDTSFAADRMFVLPAGASVTQQRSTTVPDAKSRYSLQINGAASVTTVDIGQRVRSSIVNTRGLQSQVFSVNIRNETGVSFTPNLRIGTPGSDSVFTTVTNRLDQALQACPNGVWTRVFFVFDPTAYTNIANGLECVLRLPSGSLVAGGIVRVAQFDLRPGAALLPYVAQDPDDELARSRLYCNLMQSTGINSWGVGSGGNISATVFQWSLIWPTMQAVPVITFGSVAADFQVSAGGGNTVCTAHATFSPSLDRALAQSTVAAGLTNGQGGMLNSASANASILLNAELI